MQTRAWALVGPNGVVTETVALTQHGAVAVAELYLDDKVEFTPSEVARLDQKPTRGLMPGSVSAYANAWWGFVGLRGWEMKPVEIRVAS